MIFIVVVVITNGFSLFVLISSMVEIAKIQIDYEKSLIRLSDDLSRASESNFDYDRQSESIMTSFDEEQAACENARMMSFRDNNGMDLSMIRLMEAKDLPSHNSDERKWSFNF